MKKYIFLTTIFALFTVASVEVSRYTYKILTDTTQISLEPILRASETLSNITLKLDHERRLKTIEDKLKNELEAKFRISEKRFEEKVKIAKTYNVEKKRERNLKFLEINNEKLISLKAYEVHMVKTLVVASLLNGFSLPVDNQFNIHEDKILAEKVIIKEEKNIVEKKVEEDKVSTSLSATQKLTPDEEALINELVNNVSIEEVISENNKNKKVVKTNDIDDENKDDEMLFFDYSQKENEKVVETSKKQIKKKELKPQVSFNVNPLEEEVISIDEAMKLLPAGKKVNLAMNSQTQVNSQKDLSNLYAANEKSNDYSQLIKSSLSGNQKKSYPTNAKLTVRTSLGVINDGLKKNSTPFQFVSDVSYGEPISSGSIGAIEIEEMINERVSTIRGTILSSDTFPTIVELPLEYGDFLVNIPLLDRDDVFKRFEGIRGAMLLVELNESTDSIDIDHKYVERILLNDRFKIVEEGDDYRFILYIGVEPGNTLIQYLTLNNEIGEKIVHLVEDHVLYESNTYIDSKKEKIELYETKLLGKNDLELNIDSDDVRYFNTGLGSKSIGLNLYEVERPILPLGMRKYLELKHLGESIYVGYLDKKSLHVPSREYLNYVMDTFKIGDLDNKCLIQVNFSKTIVDMRVASESYKGPIGIEKLYLDKDGMFNTEASDFAKKVFMIGDTIGTINLEVEYSDQSKDYIQTFCSSNTIIVEQL